MTVQIIEPQKSSEKTAEGAPRLLRVAAYCRVSTDSDEQRTSYEAQISYYTNYINGHSGWTLAGIFADEGLSGTQAKTRPQFNAMIEACEAGSIDLVITKSISRFARNTIDCLNYIRRLKAISVPIIFEKESINTMDASGELMVTILASIAQQESASISQNVRIGINYGFREGRGRLNYSVFLGYKRGREPGSYRIVPAQAEVVRRIYREYIEGYSPRLIADGLMDDGVRAPAGGTKWYASTIRSILENEKYAGDLLMQKYYVEDFLTHKCVRNDGARPQYFVEDDHEPIVPKAVFAQVQEEMKRRALLKHDPSKLRFGSMNALEGRLICGKCGRTLKPYTKPGQTQPDWRCRERAMVKKSASREQPLESCRCSCRIVREDEVQRALVAAFNELPEKRELLIEARERLVGGEIARIDALLASGSLQSGLEAGRDGTIPVLDSGSPQGEPKHFVVEGETGLASNSPQRRQKAKVNVADGWEARLRIQRAELANRDIQARMLLQLIEDMTGLPCDPSGATPIVADRTRKRQKAACYEYEGFFNRTRYRIPTDVLDAHGKMVRFDNDLVVRYLDKVIVQDCGFEVLFKAGVKVRLR